MTPTLVVLAVTVILFVSGKFRTDMVALGALLALTILGVLTPQEAFSGFSNTVVFTVAGMFIISGAIVRTGLAAAISSRILGVAGRNTNVLFMLVMLLSALIGSMVSNTGTVAIMMPIVVGMAMAIDESPGRFLMPLAFMSSIGGMFTLVGNSPNMVVNDVYVKAGNPSLSLFSFFPVGAVCFLFGMLILSPVASYMLSRRKNEKIRGKRNAVSLKELADSYQLRQNRYKVTVPKKSPMVGRNLLDLRLTEKNGVIVQEILRCNNPPRYLRFHRGEVQVIPGPQTVIEAGDVLHVLGSADGVLAMVRECRLHLDAAGETEPKMSDRIQFDSIGICELVLMSSSHLLNRSVIDSGLREQFGITVLSIHRGSTYLFENIKDQVMQSGDALLVQGSWENIARLEEYSMNWVVVGRPWKQAGAVQLRRRAPVVAVTVGLMIAAMAANLVPTVVAVMLAAMALIVCGCFQNMDEAYSSISWETLVMIASLLPMALALQKTGVIDIVAAQLVGVGKSYGPYAALAVVYGTTSIMNIFMSTTPVALLVAPIALQIADGLRLSPLPFLFAVATAASMCFASPFSTPSNALVLSAGRYTFYDYFKIGLPLQLLMGVVMVVALPLLFPFAAS